MSTLTKLVEENDQYRQYLSALSIEEIREELLNVWGEIAEVDQDKEELVERMVGLNEESIIRGVNF